MPKKTVFTILISFLLMVLIISACNNNKESDQKSPEAIYTEAAQTVAAELTKIAEESEKEATATWTPEPMVDSTSTPDADLPTATKSSEEDPKATATEASEPTKSGSCTLIADYVSDITIPDDTVLSPGQTFTKTWQIMNSGTCTWGDGYTIFFISGDNLSAPENVSLTHGVDVPEGTMISVSISLTAPTELGEYRADFKFEDSSGKVFGTGSNGGGTVYVKIIVAEPTPEPSNTPQATETLMPTETPTEEPTPAVTPTS